MPSPHVSGSPGPTGLAPYAAVVLAGGRARRLEGVDKATVELAGRTLLERVLDAVADAEEVVVVGEPSAGTHGLRVVREQPRFGGPVAALLAGRDALGGRSGPLAVLAVDMPHLAPATLTRLRLAAVGRDGAVLVDPAGRRQLALVLDGARLDAVAPEADDRDGQPLHRLLAHLDLVEVAAIAAEHRDVDTWADLRELEDLGQGPATTPEV